MIFYVETGIGCALIKASSIDQAEKKVISEVGTYNGVQRIRVATEEDIAWVKAMGGLVL